MRITESRLRSIIRSVIRESFESINSDEIVDAEVERIFDPRHGIRNINDIRDTEELDDALSGHTYASNELNEFGASEDIKEKIRDAVIERLGIE